MVGVILSVRPLIRMGLNQWIQSQEVINLGHIEPTLEEIEGKRQKSLDAKAFHIGVFMTLIGTLIWAYGDLIGGLP
ncbi:hypothetical protein [Acinetobacter sp. WCHAc060042]|uniref:hypothetical protein n=1 Tax=Acinetobacter sp. WCHAc060042 TaxID=2213016 RepID=UPI0013A6588E|nr:hypothetical protein [Acinetobacter sp. WCHAc060042]